jgi:hypothetical protein
MNRVSDVTTRKWESANDFRRAVVPHLERWLPPGGFISIEDAPDHPAIAVVDTVAGVDAWFVSGDGTRLHGIAQRVQYGTEPYASFTIRARLPSGGLTELTKRREALRDRDGHPVVPHFTVQAWVERRRTGRALFVHMVRTADLFAFIEQHPDKVERRPNHEDGTEFVVVWAQDLRGAGYEVLQGGEFDVTIRLRDGEWWSPFEVHDDDDADEIDGYWAERDETCMYCGVGLVGTGELCPSCGTASF